MNGYSLRGIYSCHFHFCLPCTFRSTLKGKNLFPRSKFIPLRVDPIFLGFRPPGKERESKSEVLFPFVNIAETTGNVPKHLKDPSQRAHDVKTTSCVRWDMHVADYRTYATACGDCFSSFLFSSLKQSYTAFLDPGVF